MTEADAVSTPLLAVEIPTSPAIDDAQRLPELLGDDLPRFAMTFDGYSHFGDHWGEILQARREEWEREGTLPRDVDALRGLLFLTFRQERFLELDDPADADRITGARREHERFKHALLAKMRTLV